MNELKFYLIGGACRDLLLGQKPKDLDYVCVAPSFAAMRDAVLAKGGEIFLETEKHFTLRAKVPGLGAADFVLARRDGAYSDARRPDSVEIGTLLDDQSRRDFTVNSIAQDTETGEFIDPFNGQKDLAAKVLRCVGNTQKRMAEDSLRMLRALRFVITKGFSFDPALHWFLFDEENAGLLHRISMERIREELLKCFQHDTLQTLAWLEHFKGMKRAIFRRNIILTPTVFVR